VCLCVIFLLELKILNAGTSKTDNNCSCNDEGYEPVNKTKQHGQLDKRDCVLSATQNETGLCLFCCPLIIIIIIIIRFVKRQNVKRLPWR